jgi:hypothetical protein
MATDADTRRSRAGAWAVLLTVLWVVGVPYLLLSGAMSGWQFKSYEPRSAESVAAAARYYLAAGIVAVVLPLLVTVIALYGRRTLMATIYLILTLIALMPVLTLTASGGTPFERTPPSYGPGACQEHSGGDTRCPGG